MNRYVYLFDEGLVNEKFDAYIVISPNYTKTINVLKEKHKSFVVVDDWWKDKSDIVRDKVYIEQIKDSILIYLSKELNQYHSTSYNIDEWKIVLNAWLYNYVSAFYEKFRRINQLKKLNLNFKINPVNERYYCLDFGNFERSIRNSKEFNTQIYVDLLYNIDSKEDFKKNNVVLKHEYKKTLGFYKYILYRLLIKIIIKLSNDNIKVVANDTYLPLSLLNMSMIKSKFRFINFQEDYLRHESASIKYDNIDTAWRNTNEIFNFPDEFKNIVLKYVKHYIPIAYLEGFGYLKNAQAKWFGSLNNLEAAIYICYGLTYDELYKNFLMIRKNKNKKLKLIDIQHGGNYGIDCNHWMKIEYDISDCIYTWGHEFKIDNCKALKMPMTKLLNRRFDKTKSDGTILYVNYSYFKDFTMIEPSAVIYRHAIEKEINYLKSVDNSIINRMVVRLYPDEWMWDLKKRIKKEVPNIRYDEIRDYYSSLERASLVICSDWNTTCIESLASGYPTIILQPIDEIEPQAKDDAILMRNAGLLVETWEELLLLTNQMTSTEHIKSWWSDSNRMKVAKYIKNKYAYNPENAYMIWQKELLSLCKL